MTSLAGFLPLIGMLVGLMPGLADHGPASRPELRAWSLLDCEFDSPAPSPPAEDSHHDAPGDSFLDEEEEDEDPTSCKFGPIAPSCGRSPLLRHGTRVALCPSSPGLRAFLSRSSPLRC